MLNFCSRRSMLTYPWKEIFTSKPVWAFLNDVFVKAWSVSFTFYCVPLYIKDTQNVTIESIGLISALPNLCSFMSIFLTSFLADYLRNNGIMTVSNVHKTYVTFAQTSSIVILIAMILWATPTMTIVLISVFRFCYAVADNSYHVLSLDMGGEYAGFLNGLVITAMSIGYILNPIVIGYIVSDHLISQWNLYFTLVCALNIWAGVIFLLFGSGKLQPWAVSLKTNVEKEPGDKDLNSASEKFQ